MNLRQLLDTTLETLSPRTRAAILAALEAQSVLDRDLRLKELVDLAKAIGGNVESVVAFFGWVHRPGSRYGVRLGTGAPITYPETPQAECAMRARQVADALLGIQPRMEL